MLDITKKYAQSNKTIAIPVNVEHKSKLFEMCNNILENVNPNATIYLHDKMIKIPRQGPKEFGYTEIHWFELCTTHLAFHIMSEPIEYLKHCIDYAMIEDKDEMKHPIDVLYEEYETIKDLFKSVYTNNKSLIKYGL